MAIKRYLILISVVGISATAQATCDEDALLRFQERARCWHKNNERTCGSLSFLAGTVAASALALKASQNPEYAQLKKFMDNLKSISSQLARDYRSMLKTYFELKKNSAEPNFERPVAEFSFEEFKKFEKQLKAAHPNNLFLQKLEEYGGGKANDVFQRTLTYAMEKTNVNLEFKKIANTYSGAMSLDLQRAVLIFKEVSLEKGYPDNAHASFHSSVTRQDIKERMRDRQQGMAADLQQQKASTGKQAGGATVGGLLGAAAAGGAALMPVVDLNLRRGVVSQCAQSLGLKLSESEAIEFAKSLEVQKGLASKESPCGKITFTEEGVNHLFSEKVNLTPNTREFMCRFEKRLAQKQDSINENVSWDHENCMTPSAPKSVLSSVVEKDRALIRTSSGAEVEVKWDANGEWDPFSIKSLNDEGFNQYLLDKVKHPLNLKAANSGYLNPRIMCDGREKGRYPENMCDVTKAMRVLSQNKFAAQASCANRKTHGNPGGKSLPPKGSI